MVRWRGVGIAALAAVMLLPGCKRPPADQVQGYIEGEFVYIAAPLGGSLETLGVTRGQQVKTGTSLFALERGAETAALEEARRRLAQAKARLEDARKGLRPTEVQAIEAQLQEARASLAFSDADAARLEAMSGRGSVSVHDVEKAKATRDQDRQRVARLAANLQTAKLGSRDDVVAAAGAEVEALEAAVKAADWSYSQKLQAAGQDAVVFDTFYRKGEWVAPGRPVVALLPPANVKLRAFVPQERLASLHVGDALKVKLDGISQPVTAKVSFIAPRAEYTPPVIYSRESRSKLVYLVEALFDASTAATLHPGQPVDVTLGGANGQ